MLAEKYEDKRELRKDTLKDWRGQRMSPAISVNKGYCTHHAISHCGLHPERIQDGGKNKILALDS